MAESKRKPGRPPGSKNKNGKTSRSGKSTSAKSSSDHSTSAKGANGRSTTGGNSSLNGRVRDEIVSIIFIAVGVFLVIAFQTSAAGAVGTGLSEFFKGCFGFAAYILPYYFIIYGLLLFTRKTIHVGLKSAILLLIIFLMISLMNAGRFIEADAVKEGLDNISVYYNNGMILDDGGAFGMTAGILLVKLLGIPGLYILATVVIAICLLLLMNSPVSRFFEAIKEKKRQRIIEREERMKEKERTEAERQQQMEMDLLTKDHQPTAPPDMTAGQRRILGYMKDSSFDAEKNGDGYEDIDFSLGEGESKPKRGRKSKTKLFGSNADTKGKTAEAIAAAAGISSATEPLPVTGSYSGVAVDRLASKGSGSASSDRDTSNSGNDTSGSGKDAANTSNDAVNGPVIIGGFSPKKLEEKLTKTEAAKSTLKDEDFNVHVTTQESYKFPPVSLLNKGSKANADNYDNEKNLRMKAAKLEETLHSFNIDAKVTNVTQGPAVTRYEVHPNSGVKVKGIKNLSDDIALNMEAKSIRIEAPIPGKPAVGIEIENERINMVTVREIIDSPAFRNSESKISFAVGKDIAGNAIVADLKSMPHLLIAGSTGSGKSVCINSIIASVLYKARPDEVKLVLIDPKVVELANYNGIPHLLIPVVTEPAKAAAALNWAVAEMDERYRKFAEEGARELASYNSAMIKQDKADEVMPQIVIIIDELADLMMAAPSQVEESICRLAQKARAAGMHLIVATQRPSVDVITGVIKANIPSRIAFAVSSQFDSRTILDMSGAEKLVGKGDMLFNPLGSGKPTRVQGTFISDTEVHNLIEFVKSQVEETEYAENVINTIERANMAPADKSDKEAEDELLSDAIDLVVDAQQASVSMLQRRFRIGYNRAARIIDMLEDRQIIGPSDGSRPRQVLITEEDLKNMKEETEDLE